MVLKKQSKRPVILTGLFILLALISCSPAARPDNPEIFFPFYNKIFGYNAIKKTIRVITQTNYLFTKDFYISGDGFFASCSLPDAIHKAVLFHDNNTGKTNEVFTAECSRIVLCQGYLIVVTEIAGNNSQFKYDFYAIKGQTDVRRLFSLTLDMVLSDQEVFNGQLLLGGSDILDQYNYIYSVSLKTHQFQILLKQEKHKDFIKFIKTKSNWIAYLSQQDWKENSIMKWYQFTKTETSLVENHFKPGNELEKYCFFGKGFFLNDKILFPVIDKNYNPGLIETANNSPLAAGTFHPLPSSLYSYITSLKTPDSLIVCYIGYNYYKDKNNFYLLTIPGDLSVTAPASIEKIPLML